MARKRKVNKRGFSADYRTRISQLENKKWVIEIVSRAGRLHFTSPEFLHEKQARVAAVRCLNAIRAMPHVKEEDIDSKRPYTKREKIEPLPA